MPGTCGDGSATAGMPEVSYGRWRTPTADAAEYFGLPRDRTVIMGSHIEV
ncbi:hypothetical protein ACIRYZ_36800 [Kitasatospora sp. NPDC101155]